MRFALTWLAATGLLAHGACVLEEDVSPAPPVEEQNAVLLGVEPPTTSASTTDQVPDQNVAWTHIKDYEFEGASNFAIDNYVENGSTQYGHPPLVSTTMPAGCAVGVTRGDEIVYLKGYGSADGSRPIGLDTMMPVASISKTLTALAVMKMYEEGRFGIHARMKDVVPMSYSGAVPKVATKKISRLLSHRADMRRDPVWEPGSYAKTCDDQGGIWCDIAQRILANPVAAYSQLDEANGHYDYDDFKYSNAGYLMLGAVIDRESESLPEQARGYERYVWSEIGNALPGDGDMWSLALVHPWRHDDIPNLAVGRENDGTPLHVSQTAQPRGWVGPAGAWAMTIGDLARLMLALQSNSLVSANGLAEMAAPAWHPSDSTYGYGMFVQRYQTPGGGFEDIRWHGGDFTSYQAVWSIWDETSPTVGVAIACNYKARTQSSRLLQHAWRIKELVESSRGNAER